MHIPDGMLSVPTAAATAAVGLGAAGLAVRRVERELRTREAMVPLLGILAAFVFAAQMVNFPIPGGTSGHLMGAALAAAFVGPWGAMVVLTLVVAVQCLVYADGGVTALGANVLNMAVAGPLAAWAAVRIGAGGRAGRGRFLVALGIGSWLSMTAAAFLCGMELAVSGTSPARAVIPAMTYVHMVIGLGEAAITVAVAAAVLGARPELIRRIPAGAAGAGPVRLARREVAAAAAVCLAIAMVVSSFASAAPDGLEKVAETLGFAPPEGSGAAVPAPMPDYAVRGLGEGFLGTAAAGGAGVAVLFLAGWVLYRKTGGAGVR